MEAYFPTLLSQDNDYRNDDILSSNDLDNIFEVQLHEKQPGKRCRKRKTTTTTTTNNEKENDN